MLNLSSFNLTMADVSELLMTLSFSAILGLCTKQAHIPLPSLAIQFQLFMFVLVVCILAFQPIFRLKPKFMFLTSAALFSTLVFSV